MIRGEQYLDDDLVARYLPRRRRRLDASEEGLRDAYLDGSRRLAVTEGSARAWTLAAVLFRHYAPPASFSLTSVRSPGPSS